MYIGYQNKCKLFDLSRLNIIYVKRKESLYAVPKAQVTANVNIMFHHRTRLLIVLFLGHLLLNILNLSQ
jgi:hypothetical protein